MKELRNAKISANDTAESGALVLVGQPIVFNTPTLINDPAGPYKEIIKESALDFADLSDVRLLYNHDDNRVPLARTPKTMELSVTDQGLEMKATLPDTQDAKSVYEAVKRGDLSGMSFAFTVPEGGDSYDAVTHTRTIHRISKLYECSVVVFPAYQTTSVEARSAITAETERQEKKKEARILLNQIRAESVE
jgi:HK97 family phage prohead protease